MFIYTHTDTSAYRQSKPHNSLAQQALDCGGFRSVATIQNIYIYTYFVKEANKSVQIAIYIYIDRLTSSCVHNETLWFQGWWVVLLDADQCQDGKPMAAQKIAEDA